MFARISRSTSGLARRLPGDAAAPQKHNLATSQLNITATVRQSMQREFTSPHFLHTSRQSAGLYRGTAWRISFGDLFRSGPAAANFHRMAGSPDGPQDSQKRRPVAGLRTWKTRRDRHRRLPDAWVSRSLHRIFQGPCYETFGSVLSAYGCAFDAGDVAQSIRRRSALCKSALASVAPLKSGHSAQISRGVRRG
jgi:hypothetical protein